MEANTALATRDTAGLLEQVVIGGDLDKLSPAERMAYYKQICESVGLNPFTRPFEYLRLQGKLILYARKDATDQLRKVHGVSIVGLEQATTDDVRIVMATARTADGREDTDAGAVNVRGLGGEALANAYMKAITKAKRRVTLSICGLGMLDETEIESIPDARPVRVEEVHAEPVAPRPQPAAAPARPAPQPQPAPATNGDLASTPQINAINAIGGKLGLTVEQLRGRAFGMFKVERLHQLTKRQASDFITALQQQIPQQQDDGVPAAFAEPAERAF